MSYLKAIEEHRNLELASWPGLVQNAFQHFSTEGEKLILSLPNAYDSKLLFQRMGIENADFIKAIDTLMIPIYLGGDFIELDTSYLGAASFLNSIYRVHGKVFFVTSRYQDVQTIPTLANLKKLGLYRRNASQLVLRKRGETSIQFKTRSFHDIKNSLSSKEEVFVVGENEPENLNAMIDAFPHAIPIFVQGAFLNGSVSLNPLAPILMTHDFRDDSL